MTITFSPSQCPTYSCHDTNTQHTHFEPNNSLLWLNVFHSLVDFVDSNREVQSVRGPRSEGSHGGQTGGITPRQRTLGSGVSVAPLPSESGQKQTCSQMHQ
jgi:hypothetical protein